MRRRSLAAVGLAASCLLSVHCGGDADLEVGRGSLLEAFAESRPSLRDLAARGTELAQEQPLIFRLLYEDSVSSLFGDGGWSRFQSRDGAGGVQRFVRVEPGTWYVAAAIYDGGAGGAGAEIVVDEVAPGADRRPFRQRVDPTAAGPRLVTLPFRVGPATRQIRIRLRVAEQDELTFRDAALFERRGALFTGTQAPDDADAAASWAETVGGLTLADYRLWVDNAPQFDAAYFLQTSVFEPAAATGHVRSDDATLVAPQVFVDLHEDFRWALAGAAPSDLRTRIALPSEGVAQLRLAYGVPGYALRRPGREIRFSVSIVVSDETRKVFDAVVDTDAIEPGDGWQESVVDLTDFAGKTVEAVLTMDGPGGSVGLWAAPRLVTDGNVEPPNVVMIALDTLRADELAPWGGDPAVAPNLNALANRGAVFERAISPAPYTLPSFASLFTGTQPWEHGALGGIGGLREGIPTLAETLHDFGYRTAALAGRGYLAPQFGLWRGFEEYRMAATPAVFERGAEILETAGGDPTFLFLQTYEVHHPYVEKPDAIREFWPEFETWRDEHFDARQQSELMDLRRLRRGTDISAEGRRLLRTLYRGQVNQVDELVGAFLRRIEGLDTDRETLVVLLSDHGEHFGEHERFLHGNSLFNELLHVPLVFHWPGRIPPARLSGVASLVDVMPTIVELVGGPVADSQAGRSLLAELPLGSDAAVEAAAPVRPVFAAMLSDRSTKLAVFDGDDKLIVDGDERRSSMYDWRADWEESEDLFGSRDGRALELAELLIRAAATAPGTHLLWRLPQPASVRGVLEGVGFSEVRPLFFDPHDRVEPIDANALQLEFDGGRGYRWLWVYPPEPVDLRLSGPAPLRRSVLLEEPPSLAGARTEPWRSAGLYSWIQSETGSRFVGRLAAGQLNELVRNMRALGYIE